VRFELADGDDVFGDFEFGRSGHRQ
jgi:hypothetical protein